jgi:hypothetical protein
MGVFAKFVVVIEILAEGLRRRASAGETRRSQPVDHCRNQIAAQDEPRPAGASAILVRFS